MKQRNKMVSILIIVVLLISIGAFIFFRYNLPNCSYQVIDTQKHGQQKFQNPPVIRSQNGVLSMTLKVKYWKRKIAGCHTNLRSYNGMPMGPTLLVKPGDTLKIKLVNQLPKEKHPMQKDHNIPHYFNTTNLHTHGLHVSPSGRSDNVLLRIKPGESFDYEIKIPKDHTPGTHWYHAHVHGSTALHTSSGMAGTIIVAGGIDQVKSLKNIKNKIFLFQQLAYDHEGELENYYSFSAKGWQDSHRHTLINGKIVPVIHMRPGEIQRWRFIHGGVKETLSLHLQGHKLHEIATDGIPLGKIDSWSAVVLHSGYRSDVLVKAKLLPKNKKIMTYWLIDQATKKKDSMLEDEDEMILAKIIVSGKLMHMSLPKNSELSSLKPKDIREDEVTGTQYVRFSVAIKDNKLQFMVNERAFSPKHVRTLTLNRVEKWHVKTSEDSLKANHPFHIHVNPFQFTRIGPDGKPEKVWKDTLMIKKGYPKILYTRYKKFTGKFVMHCHILDHEDRGMMELIEIKK